MNSQNFNDLVPRPSPKPSQIEVPIISNGPEVPEVSLLLDSNVRRTEFSRMQPIKDYSIDRLRAPMGGHLSAPSCASVYSSERPPDSKHEQSNCCCGSESYRLNSHASLTPPHFDYRRNSEHVNLGYDSKNGMHTQNQYSAFPPFMKQCVGELKDSANMNQSYVTLDDYQKMVSQFTNMILKLNYKFNQVLDNSISREELNQMTRKFELQVENLTQRVNELSLKLERTSSEVASRQAAECKCCQRISDPVIRCVNDHKCYQVPQCNSEVELNDSPQIPGQSPKQLCILSNGQQRQPDFECKNYQRVETDDLRTDRASQDRTNSLGAIPDGPVFECINLRRNVENFEPLQQSDKQRQCYSSREHKLPSNNVIVSSDLSVLMNTLAMKYIPDGQCDPKKQDSRLEHDIVMRNAANCSNVSMATLQYMERYQLLSSRDQNSAKPLGVNKTRSSAPSQPFDSSNVREAQLLDVNKTKF